MLSEDKIEVMLSDLVNDNDHLVIFDRYPLYSSSDPLFRVTLAKIWVTFPEDRHPTWCPGLHFDMTPSLVRREHGM